MSHEPLMHYSPCASLRNSKKTWIKHRKRVSALKTRKLSEQRINGLFKRIMAEKIIISLIPNLKHILKENLKCFIKKALHRHKWRRIDSSQRPKCHMCLKVFKSGIELIDRDQILYLDVAEELLLPGI